MGKILSFVIIWRDLVSGMNKLTKSKLISHDKLEAQIVARDRQIDNPFSKDAQITAILAARNYRGDKLIRTAKPHKFSTQMLAR